MVFEYKHNGKTVKVSANNKESADKFFEMRYGKVEEVVETVEETVQEVMVEMILEEEHDLEDGEV